MPFTNDMKLPSNEELTVPEVNLSIAALFAGALHLGKVCEDANNEFVLCKTERYDPRECLEEGKEVTKCAINFFQQIKKQCREEFELFATCLHKNSSEYSFSRCRNTQAAFDKCMLDKVGVERPPWGYCTEIHVHKAKRERPVREPVVWPDAPVPFIPPEKPKPAKHGYRGYT